MTIPQPSREHAYGHEVIPADSNLPVPDPTRMTTALIDRTVAAFREVFEVRFAELNRAIALTTSQVNKLPAEIDAKSSQLRADIDRQMLGLREYIISQIEMLQGVHAEKFRAVDIRFTERDALVAQVAQESRLSLAAAKEAVVEQNKANEQAIAKFELATQKQIDAMTQLMTNSNKSLEDKIAELKTRLDRGEGRSTGTTESKAEKRLDAGTALQTIAVLLTVIGLVIVVLNK
jgi:DNA-binding transcriptional MerR regulator